jgi:hypothetical protein
MVALHQKCALASCDNPISGSSKMFNVEIYTVSGCNPNSKFPDGTEVINFTSLPLKKIDAFGTLQGDERTVRFGDECKWIKKRDNLSFGLSCAQNGHTPLAGTTYVTTRDKKDECDETGKTLVDRLTCVKGCEGGRAPKYLEGSPWEC